MRDESFSIMSNQRKQFTHFKPDQVMIPHTENGGEAEEGTNIVIDEKGVVAFVGNEADAEDFISAREMDGAYIQKERGGVALPGMTDTHYHPAIYGSLQLLKSTSAESTNTLAKLKSQVQEIMKQYDEKGRGNEPLIVFNYDSSLLGPMENLPFDEVESERPVFFIDRSFHGGAGNSKAMELLDRYIKSNYQDRAAKGAPFPGDVKGNVFSETYVQLALELAESLQDIEQVKEKLESQVEHYLGKGVTAMHEMEVMSWHEFMGYLLFHKKWKEEHRDMEFPVRQIFLDERVIRKLVMQQDELARSGLFTDEMRGLFGVKFFADGAIGCETALMGEAYQGHEHDRKKHHGRIVTRIKEAERAMRNALELGLDKIAVHAIGDAGIARALDFARRWQSIARQKHIDPKFRIEHFELPLGGIIKETGELGAWVSMQPNFGVEDQIYHDRLGGRTRVVCPHSDIVNEGVPMMLGSDGMPDSMLYVVWSAMHHPDPNQRLDAISAMTAASAAAGAYEGDLRGILREGSKTDIVIASPDILNAFADNKPLEQYLEESLMPQDKRPSPTIRNHVGVLEGNILKVFAQGKLVHDVTKGRN